MDNKKLNIAVVINTVLKVGGGFTYANNIVEQLLKWNQNRFNFLFYSDKYETVEYLKTKDLNCTLIFSGFRSTLKTIIKHKNRQLRIAKKVSLLFKEDYIDLAYFLGPFSTWTDLVNTRFIFTIHDLGHRDALVFPEVYNNGEFQRRETIYKGGAIQSFATVVDSEITKNKLLNFYGVNSDKVEVLEFLPNIELAKVDADLGKTIITKFNILEPFIFYPAQFWAHKNHKYILDGIKLYEEITNTRLHAVFSGADYGNLNYILNKAKILNINEQIHYVGFVSNEEMAYLYKNCIALVMPTYITNTNIPPLEAFMFKVPVLYPNTLECTNILKQATININLTDSNSFVESIQKVIDNSDEVKEKISLGYNYINNLQKSNYIEPIAKILNRYWEMRQLWD